MLIDERHGFQNGKQKRIDPRNNHFFREGFRSPIGPVDVPEFGSVMLRIGFDQITMKER